VTSYDPHDDDAFIAKNLNPEEWVEYCRDEKTSIIANEMIKAFDEGLVARIHNSELDEIGFLIACKAGTFAPLISMRHHAHWAGIALCMLTHGKMEVYEEENVTRFSRSPYDNPPMWYDCIEYVQCPGKSWMMPIRKKATDETKDTRPSRNGENNLSTSVSRKGNTERDSPQQNLFSDLY
jgi:hypothetical protein